MGLFITLEPPTREMILEATKSGFYRFVPMDRDFARVQILTIEPPPILLVERL